MHIIHDTPFVLLIHLVGIAFDFYFAHSDAFILGLAQELDQSLGDLGLHFGQGDLLLLPGAEAVPGGGALGICNCLLDGRLQLLGQVLGGELPGFIIPVHPVGV